MKILLLGINSRYTHTNLALRYMRESLINHGFSVDLKEYTINNEIDFIIGDINYEDYNYICFSTYIWNIEEVEKICEVIKKSNNKITTIFGGPEATYSSGDYFDQNPFVDIIIRGEGEEVLPALIEKLEKEEDLEDLMGLIYRKKKDVVDKTGINKIKNINLLPFPYEQEYNLKAKKQIFKNKYIYYESTRGCPYSCGFCLSSTDKGIRALSLDRVKKDLDKIYELEPLIIKFVDRTFNYDWKRSMEIMKYISNKDQKIKVHYEITADIINIEFLNFLKTLPDDIFQFEVGLQTTNEYTLNEIHRKMNLENIRYVVKELSKAGNIHLHVDLIAGLPKENYLSFINSFNEAYNLGAEKLQLGFLKVLKGTDVYYNRKENGLVYRSFPPYEIIKTKDINQKEILQLKKIDSILNKYYSEGYFSNTINYILKKYYKDPFGFYLDMAAYWEKNDYYSQYHKRKKLYEILYGFIVEKEYLDKNIEDALVTDYALHNQNLELPSYLNTNREDKYKKYKRIINRNQTFIDKYFSNLYEKLNKKIINNFRIIEIDSKPRLFIYDQDKCTMVDIEEDLEILRKDDWFEYR